MALKWLLAGIAGLLILVGVITFPLPIPIGLPLILIGASLLLRSSRRSRRKVVQFINRSPRLAALLRKRRTSKKRHRGRNSNPQAQ